MLHTQYLHYLFELIALRAWTVSHEPHVSRGPIQICGCCDLLSVNNYYRAKMVGFPCGMDDDAAMTAPDDIVTCSLDTG